MELENLGVILGIIVVNINFSVVSNKEIHNLEGFLSQFITLKMAFLPDLHQGTLPSDPVIGMPPLLHEFLYPDAALDLIYKYANPYGKPYRCQVLVVKISSTSTS